MQLFIKVGFFLLNLRQGIIHNFVLASIVKVTNFSYDKKDCQHATDYNDKRCAKTNTHLCIVGDRLEIKLALDSC